MHSICDYSVMVRNLPQDCSFEQLLSHFSNIYGLDKKDWNGRLPVEGAHPVTSVGIISIFMLIFIYIYDKDQNEMILHSKFLLVDN